MGSLPFGDVVKEHDHAVNFTVFPQWRYVRLKIPVSVVGTNGSYLSLRVLTSQSTVESTSNSVAEINCDEVGEALTKQRNRIANFCSLINPGNSADGIEGVDFIWRSIGKICHERPVGNCLSFSLA